MGGYGFNLLMLPPSSQFVETLPAVKLEEWTDVGKNRVDNSN